MRPMTMGAEGMAWLGVEHFVEMPHVFQNMGDGTYAHSGLLAIRAAVATQATLTYKILYNDAVAMTGGQPVEGAPQPQDIAAQLLAEGVKPIAVVYDLQEDIDRAAFPSTIEFHERAHLDKVQKKLRTIGGVSAIIYVQTCAAEKRRRRKRDRYPDPAKRVFINPDVCEGCGDCSVQANCISIQPLETDFGRKRKIDQSNCNKDYSCLKGFCPSFITIQGGRFIGQVAEKRPVDAAIEALPEPEQAKLGTETFNILVTGIGGTGVLTVGALIGMAAHIEGKGCTVMDMTGMAQKGGAVTSHIRMAKDPSNIHTARFDLAMSDVILACDMIVATGQDVLKTIKPGQTVAVLNTDVAPTGAFQRDHNLDFSAGSLVPIMQKAIEGDRTCLVPATRLATQMIGDSISTNLLMLGYALQKGLLPVSRAAVEQAIRLNGVAVEASIRTLAIGRLYAHAPEVLDIDGNEDAASQNSDSLDKIIAIHEALLSDYQNKKYAARYSRLVDRVRNVVSRDQLENGDLLARAVAVTFARLMAYKDEYEVARLHSNSRFWDNLKRQFDGNISIKFHLAPPILARLDPATGRPRKMTFGGWMKPVFVLLSGLKFLRGTLFDPFGYTRERRMERALIIEYEQLVSDILDRLDKTNLHLAIDLANAAFDIRGYGPVKDKSLEVYRQRRQSLWQAFISPVSVNGTGLTGEDMVLEKSN